MTKIAQVYETARCVRIISADMELYENSPVKTTTAPGQPTLLALAYSKCWYGTEGRSTESPRMPWDRFDVKRTRPRLALACVEPVLPTHEVDEARVPGDHWEPSGKLT